MNNGVTEVAASRRGFKADCTGALASFDRLCHQPHPQLRAVMRSTDF